MNKTITTRQTHKALYVLVGLSLWLGGCATQTYAPEAGFGSSVREAIARHTVNPQGYGKDGVTPGMDGATAKATIDRYVKSAEQPLATGDTYRVGIGDAGSGGGLVRLPSAR